MGFFNDATGDMCHASSPDKTSTVAASADITRLPVNTLSQPSATRNVQFPVHDLIFFPSLTVPLSLSLSLKVTVSETLSSVLPCT